MEFNEYDWHDAIIKNIKINRNNPGIRDEIEMEIVWPENKERVNFIFEDVYWAKMDLNFGIVSNENIAQAFLLQKSDDDLNNFYLKWNGHMDDIKLNVYEVLLSSTGGKIKIIAKTFKVDKL
ncbi:hypothetical protein [Flavobacterium inviolabile]|uniref:hypothetical protein n=1 Tax=Flavobacterium inviolabile TaxID=2748320 RepID=UPI0015A826AF|nr:hypothetical protein [Flavobacterium inviolabile]